MNRVLVTGASGFVGGHLVKALARRGLDVRVLVRSHAAADRFREQQVGVALGDLCDAESLPAAVADRDTIFHVGGVIAVVRYDDFDRVNGGGTRNLVAACQRLSQPPRFIQVSSISAVGPIARGSVRTEDAAPNPISRYGISKRAGEAAVEAAADRMPVTVVRPGVVFGPRDKELLVAFRAIRNTFVHVSPRRRNPPLSYIEVRDLAELLITAAERGRCIEPPGSTTPGTGEGYYFATHDEFPCYRKFGQLAAQAMGRRFAVPCVPPRPIPWCIALVGETIAKLRGKPVVFGRDKFREAIASSWACSNQRAREQLGFHPSAPLLEQLRATVEWYRQEGWL